MLSRVAASSTSDFEARAASNDPDLEAYYEFKERYAVDLASDFLVDERTSLMRQRMVSNCTSGGGGGGGRPVKPPSPRQRGE